MFKLADGSLFAAANDYEGGEILLAALKKKLPTPKLNKDQSTNAIHIRRDGSVWLYEGAIWVRSRSKFHTIGTGGPYALGALHMGATAKEAVSVAMKCDVYSGGKVQTVRLGK